MRIKGMISMLVMLVVCIGIIANTTQAQEMETELNVVADVIVKPSRESDFFVAVEEEVAVYSKYNYPYSWDVYSTGDYHYYFAIPVKNFADIDNFFRAGEDVADKGAEEFQAMLEKFKGTYEYLRFTLYTYTPELSFLTENSEQVEDEMNYCFWDFHYVKPGWTNEYEEVVKELMALAKKKNVNQKWYCYVGGMGTDEPLYVYAATAKNAVDYQSQNMKMWESLGDEGSELYDKFMTYIRKREYKSGWYHQDLSYRPEEK